MRKGRVLSDADIKTSGPRPPFSTPLLVSLPFSIFQPHTPSTLSVGGLTR